MYHICPSQSQIQLAGRKQIYARRRLAQAIARGAGLARVCASRRHRNPPHERAPRTVREAIACSTLAKPVMTSPALLAIDKAWRQSFVNRASISAAKLSEAAAFVLKPREKACRWTASAMRSSARLPKRRVPAICGRCRAPQSHPVRGQSESCPPASLSSG